MEALPLVLGAVALLAIGLAIYALRQSKGGAAAEEARAELAEARIELNEARAGLLRQEGERAAAVERATRAERETEALRASEHEAVERATRAERERAVTQEKIAALETERGNFEAHQRRMIEQANAAILDAGNKMSSKLLADHKQETEAAKKESAALNEASRKQASELTAKLFEQFNLVSGEVKAMQRDGQRLKSEVDIMVRTMTHPGGAGRLAEVGLENVLKGFGLEAGRDFDMQLHIAGDDGSLRPDAVVYLPQDMVLVIDSKASKHMVEIVRHEGTDAEKEHFAAFLKTMNEHARGLAHKNYRVALEAHCKQKQRKLGTVLSLMYFPSEAFIERVRHDDPGLIAFLQEKKIMLVGPTMLFGVCGLASTKLAEMRRDDQQQAIVEAVGALMENIAVVFDHAGGMGKGIKKLAEDYQKLVGALNRNTLPRMKRLGKLEVRPAKNKAIPLPLPTYEVLKHEEVLDLEAESDDGGNVLALR